MGKRNPDADDPMTTEEAERLLGLSPDMVRVLEREGRLSARRTTNGVRLFRLGGVERLAHERAKASAKGDPGLVPGAASRQPRGESEENA